MAVVENRASEAGDVLYIQTEVPLLGLVTLSGFTDATTGENAEAEFHKEFRYSLDGFLWSEWIWLTNENLNLVPVKPTDNLYLEQRYIYTGEGNPLEWQNTQFEGVYRDVQNGQTYDTSLFSTFHSKDVTVLNWAINVAEKLYFQGIVPNYIERGKNEDNLEDKDFIDFWRTITTFFAYLVTFARQFESLETNNSFLKEYLRNEGLFFPEDTTNPELLHLMKNLYSEIGKRGTAEIFKFKNDENLVDGELLRLLCHKANDEFLWCLSEPQQTGWNVDNSSPMFRSFDTFKQFNKWYEKSIDNLNLYPVLQSGSGTLPEIVDGVLVLPQEPEGEPVGIGYGSSPKTIPIQDNLTYEFTIKVKGTGKLTFGAYFKNAAGQHLICKTADRKQDTNLFFSVKSFNRSDIEYTVRGILYGKNQPTVATVNSTLNIGFGKNLILPDGTVKMIPVIWAEDGGNFTISEISLKPVPEYGFGFVDSGNILHFWLKNNNGSLSDLGLEETIRRFFVPYNSTFILNHVKQVPQVDLTGVLGAVVHEIKDVSTFGGSDGKIAVNVLNGVEPYSFVWSNSQTTQDLENIPAGTYDVEITDGVDNKVTLQNVVVNQPARQTAWRVKQDTAYCLPADVPPPTEEEIPEDNVLYQPPQEEEPIEGNPTGGGES